MARPKSAKPPARPASAVLAAAAGVAAVSALWALSLWHELRVARSGGAVSCGFGGDGAACVAAWDSPFAGVVHGWTGLPVAGWGLAWSLVALALPLAALLARRRRRTGAAAVAAATLVAVGGVVAVLVLAGALLLGGDLCQSCMITYGLVLAYAAALFLGGGRIPRPELGRAAGTAVALVGLAWVVLLVPGLRTPRTTATPLAATAQREEAIPRDLESFVASLTPRSAQALSDALHAWSEAEPGPRRSPRGLVGSSMAPVQITDFADVLCPHCAVLHRTLEELRELAPRDSFSVESRYFPLDGACNPKISRASDGVRCTAARALICISGQPRFFELAGRLYENQRGLGEEQIFSLLAPAGDRATLEACIASPETEARLQEDIAWAADYAITGTPMVIANGRKASAYPAFLYALVLSGGDVEHPAFAALPPPKGG